MYLDDVDAGTRVHLDSVPAADLRARLLRLGFLDGPVTCRSRIRNGPVVIRRKGTDLAIGKSVAESITVTPVGEGADNGGRARKRKRKRGDSKAERSRGGGNPEQSGGDGNVEQSGGDDNVERGREGGNAERSGGDSKADRVVRTKRNGGR